MVTRRTSRAAAPPAAAPPEGSEWRDVVPMANGSMQHPPPALSGALVDDPEDDEPEEETGLERILTLVRGSADDRAKVKLYRVRDGIEAWCADLSTSEFEAGGYQTIRRRWGSGDYVLMVYGVHPRTGRSARLARERFTIESEQESQAPASTATDAMLRALLDGQQALIAALANRPAVDPMESMRGTLALAAQMREAFGMNANPAPAPAAGGALMEALGLLKSLKEVAGDLLPEREPPKSDLAEMIGMAAPIMDMVKSALAARQNPAPALPAPVAPLTLPGSIAAAPAPDLQPLQAFAEAIARLPENERERHMQELLDALQHLLSLAVAGRPPQEGADFMADKLPDEVLDLLEVPNWFEALSTFQPQVKPHEAWIRDAVELMFEDDAADDAQPAGGHAPATGVVPRNGPVVDAPASVDMVPHASADLHTPRARGKVTPADGS
jgi:hypothetical protein